MGWALQNKPHNKKQLIEEKAENIFENEHFTAKSYSIVCEYKSPKLGSLREQSYLLKYILLSLYNCLK